LKLFETSVRNLKNLLRKIFCKFYANYWKILFLKDSKFPGAHVAGLDGRSGLDRGIRG
jgi:hypothetical protein